MKDPIFKNVDMSDVSYPCVSFVIRRFGINCTPYEFIKFMEKKAKPYKGGEFLPHDVIIFGNEDTYDIEACSSIDKHGRSIFTKIKRGFHLGIVEDEVTDYLISDFTFTDYNLPHVRVSKLHDRGHIHKFITESDILEFREKMKRKGNNATPNI